MAGITIALSKSENGGFTPVSLQLLAETHPDRKVSARTKGLRVHSIADRLGPEKVSEILKRYEAGESARSLAIEHLVSPSALTRLLRENHIVMKRTPIDVALAAQMAKEYEAGATIAELEAKHRRSHGAVMRALHRQDITMRAKAPRRKQH